MHSSPGIFLKRNFLVVSEVYHDGTNLYRVSQRREQTSLAAKGFVRAQALLDI